MLSWVCGLDLTLGPRVPRSLGALDPLSISDREIHDRYTLTVMAVDAGQPPKSGTAVIDVLVMDVNDNSPSFPSVRPIRISESTFDPWVLL